MMGSYWSVQNMDCVAVGAGNRAVAVGCYSRSIWIRGDRIDW